MFRDATLKDLPVFMELWTEFLKELESLGGEYVPDRDTLGDVRALFTAYTEGSRFGACVLYDPPGEGPQGAALSGESWGPQAIRPQKWGKVAWGWGVYIRPSHRRAKIGFHLQVNIGRKLQKLGFDTMVGDILLANEASFAATKLAGCRPHSIVHIVHLGEWDHGDQRQE